VRKLRTGVGVVTAAMLLAAAFQGLVSAQTISPDEVRVTTHPYSPKPTIRLETDLVQLEVVVRDFRGRAVCGLAKEDFAVYDSGKSRDLSAFSVDVAAPSAVTIPKPAGAATPPAASQFPPDFDPARNRWVALVFDDINTPTGDLARVKVAARRFIEQAAASGDRVAVFTTSGGEVLEFTGNVAAILAAAANVESHPRASPEGLAPCPRITAYEAYQIVIGNAMVLQAKVAEACNCSGGPGCAGESLPSPNPGSRPTRGPNGAGGTVVVQVQAQARQTWEQARAASEATLAAIQRSLDQLRDSPGRRMLLLASSGFLSGTLEDEQDDIINQAVRGGVVISSLDAKGTYAETPGRPINEPSEEVKPSASSTILQIESLGDRLDSLDSTMARFAESTGGQFFRNNNDFDFGFYELGVAPACTYLMGFPPAEDGKYHKIKIKLRNKSGNFLQARPGYFARGKPFPRRPEPVDALEAAATGSDERTELQATSSETPGNIAAKGRQLIIRTHLDLQNVDFRTEGDRRVQQVAFVAALFSPDGGWVIGTESVMDLTLKPESFEQLSKTGITGVMSLEAPPGAYRLRIVVQEALDGKMSATSKEIRIPQR
jgi:VWFA-related protein